MSSFHTFKKSEDMVKYYLTEFPHLRESDEKLVCAIWSDECGDTIGMTAFDFLTKIVNKQLTSGESITRHARALRKEFPLLRGSNYSDKKQEQEVYRSNLAK